MHFLLGCEPNPNSLFFRSISVVQAWPLLKMKLNAAKSLVCDGRNFKFFTVFLCSVETLTFLSFGWHPFSYCQRMWDDKLSSFVDFPIHKFRRRSTLTFSLLLLLLLPPMDGHYATRVREKRARRVSLERGGVRSPTTSPSRLYVKDKFFFIYFQVL